MRVEIVKAVAESLNYTNITDLNMSNNEIDDDLVIVFTKSFNGNQIRSIEFQDNDEIGDRGAIALANMLRGSKITCLGLDNNKIGDRGATAFAKALKDCQLVQLDLACNFIGDEGLTAFSQTAKYSNIIYLKLRFNNITQQKLVDFYKMLNEQRYLKVEKECKRLQDIFLNEENEFKDLAEISTKDKLEFVEIIEKSGIYAFASYTRGFWSWGLKFEDDISSKLSEIIFRTKELQAMNKEAQYKQTVAASHEIRSAKLEAENIALKKQIADFLSEQKSQANTSASSHNADQNSQMIAMLMEQVNELRKDKDELRKEKEASKLELEKLKEDIAVKDAMLQESETRKHALEEQLAEKYTKKALPSISETDDNTTSVEMDFPKAEEEGQQSIKPAATDASWDILSDLCQHPSSYDDMSLAGANPLVYDHTDS